MTVNPKAPTTMSVVEVDLEKQEQLTQKKKDAGVVVTVTAVHPVDDSLTPVDTPTTSVLDLTTPLPDHEKAEYEESFPEGGLRAWLVVLGGWCGLFGAMGILNSMSIFNAYISKNQLALYPAATTGWIWSLFMFLSLFPGIYVGPIFDAYGPFWLMWPGTLLLAGGIFTSSFATQYWHFLLTFSLLTGVGASMIYSPAIAAASHWFKDRRPLALGIIGTGSVSAGIILPFFLQGLLEMVGYAWTMRAMALLELVLLTTASLLVRTRLPPVKGASIHPNLAIFRDMAFLVTTLADFCMELAIYTPITYLSSYALAAGYPQSMSFAIVAILNGASVFGRVSPGLIVPLAGPFNCMCIAISICIVAVLGILFPTGQMMGGLIAFAVVYGLGCGCAMTLVPLCVGKLCDTRKLGSYFAGMYVIVSWGYLFGTPIAGALIGARGYGGIFVFAAVLLAISAVLFGCVRVMKQGWNLSRF